MPQRGRSPYAFGRTVPAVADNVASIRREVVALATRGGAHETLATDIALAVGEACANVVVHAYPPDDVGPLIVHAEIRDGVLHVSVIDQGQGMVPRPDSPGLGLGLPLIANLTDTLTINDGPGNLGTEVLMTFPLGGAEPAG
jgi:serine/threonine-protein kinase RsbW